MNTPDNYGNKQPEASGYVGIPAGPDLWKWEGYKDFGWNHKYRRQIKSLFCTIVAYAFFFGVFVGLLIMFEVLKNRIQ